MPTDLVQSPIDVGVADEVVIDVGGVGMRFAARGTALVRRREFYALLKALRALFYAELLRLLEPLGENSVL